MSLHNRPLILPLQLYVPHVSIYRGKIVLWKIMTKLHSINKLGMAKREHRVSEGLMEVSQALDYKYVRYSWTLLKRERLLKAGRKTECFSLRSISSSPPPSATLSTCSHYSQHAAPHWGSDKALSTQAVVVYGRQTPLFLPRCWIYSLWETGRCAVILWDSETTQSVTEPYTEAKRTVYSGTDRG